MLWAFYQRRGLGLKPPEIIQAISDIAIPLLLMTHFVGTRGAHEIFGVDDSYRFLLIVHWVLDTDYIAMQMTGAIITWVHGCMGIHYWLRLKPWYGRVFPYLYAAFLIVPLVSLLGYVEAGREIAELAKTEGWVREQLALAGLPGRDGIARLVAIVDLSRAALVAAVVLIFLARFWRGIIESRRRRVRVTYPDGRVVSSPPGATILEISRRFAIPHASVCGGRGRCSTCRVRITEGIDGLAPASADEQRVLDCAFRGKAATDSDLIRPPIPRQNGQSGCSCDRVRWVILTGATFAPFREERGCPGRDCPCVKYTTFYGCMPSDCRSGGLPSV